MQAASAQDLLRAQPFVLLQSELDAPVMHATSEGLLATYSAPAPYPGRRNEDALAVADLGERGVLALVADGAGGQPAGDKASKVATQAVIDSVLETEDVRSGILSGFERANEAVLNLGVGAATTLAVAHWSGGVLRTYHAGDSQVLVTGQRGKLKLQTISHSPVGYAVEAGVLDELDAMGHIDRHLVSNLLGSHDMRIEIGPLHQLGARDTVVLASDGLFDNLNPSEISECVRTGTLEEATKRLVQAARDRMLGETLPSKPDDLTLVVMRRTARRPRQTRPMPT